MKKMAYKDFTIKAIVTDFSRTESLLKDLAVLKGIDHQKDTYFNVSKGKLKLRQGTIENLITHYERIEDDGMEKTIVYQYDANPTRNQIDSLFQNHKIIGTVEKIRRIYFSGIIKIHLDTLPDQRTFIEIEAIDSSDSIQSEELKAQCISMKRKLEISDEYLVKTGYLAAES
ncbi:MAG: class IV adenylate cyclase [Cyclobacteriaceae bacterium]|nr:class IV adenylate cyclase [Cyclobacteriaceae bacterium]